MTPEQATRLMELLEAMYHDIGLCTMALMGLLLLDTIRGARGK